MSGGGHKFGVTNKDLDRLGDGLSGTIHYGHIMRTIYATDASSYRMPPLAVALPESHEDVGRLVRFASEKRVPLTPRAAGTSLSGQPIGRGIVVDVGRHMNQILDVNKTEKWARIEPGVIRNELNEYLEPYGLFFGPETSTQNRAMVGGMMGNNSCGANSVVYRDSRKHLLEARGFLADGSEVMFGELTKDEFGDKCEGNPALLETKIYRHIKEMMSDPENREEIERSFPDKKIFRRNTGYALDAISGMEPFSEGGEPFNFCKLIAGSAGTLMFMTELRVNLVPHPPPARSLVCINFKTLDDALRANVSVCKHDIMACELIDDYTVECARQNPVLNDELFFIQGRPGAVLLIEVAREDDAQAQAAAEKIIEDVKKTGYGYHFPIVTGAGVDHVWHLRNAALGVASNVTGDDKPATNIDDCAVSVEDLPDFIADVDALLKKNNLPVMYYAHASAGELHITPYFNTKTVEGAEMFRNITRDTAAIVKKYGGFLSGEHGTGWLRGEFTEFMLGEKVYGMMKDVKAAWDPDGIFNPGTIVDAPRNNINLRYEPGSVERRFETVFDFGEEGFVRHAERCNGTAECRKTEHAGGTMCPSYMATRDEMHVTRARANMLREIFTRSGEADPFQNEEIHEVLDLCLSCKGCKSECPSDVDIAKLKAEFLQHYYDRHGVPLRSRMIAAFNTLARLNSAFPQAYNFVFGNPVTAPVVKKLTGFALKRSVPPLSLEPAKKWYGKNKHALTGGRYGKVFVFCDEFTNYLDAEIGVAAIKLLDRLGYYPEVIEHDESGRAHISKGLIRDAKAIANRNIKTFEGLITDGTPLVGIEPSAVLSFRDEYPDLAEPDLKKASEEIARNTFLFEEFISREIDRGNITKEMFTDDDRDLIFHGHCQQKALSSLSHAEKILSLPENYSVKILPTGCCGMAGSFGYESEHYDVSMKVGELVLLPSVRNRASGVIVVAPGTSCRHQIRDGAHTRAYHPAEVLWDALA